MSTCFLFLFKNIILLMIFESKRVLWGVTKLLASEKSLSDGTEVAGIERYFIAILCNIGYWALFVAHHAKESYSSRAGNSGKLR